MSEVHHLFRIDIGFDPDRGYAATVLDVEGQRQKGIRGNSIQQLISRIRNVVNEEVGRRSHFPKESERNSIITNGF
jgi:hypothetical protein